MNAGESVCYVNERVLYQVSSRLAELSNFRPIGVSAVSNADTKTYKIYELILGGHNSAVVGTTD